jgi:hypothetical protein
MQHGRSCLLLALEIGGVTTPWSNSVPVGLLVGFGLIIVVLVVLEWKQGETSMVVFRIAKHRTIAAFCVFGFCVHSSSFARNYNLPIYFQAVQGVSPSKSGIRTLPTVLTGCEFYPPSPLTIHHHLSTQDTEHLLKQHFSVWWALSSWVKLVTGSRSSRLGVSFLWSAQA